MMQTSSPTVSCHPTIDIVLSMSPTLSTSIANNNTTHASIDKKRKLTDSDAVISMCPKLKQHRPMSPVDYARSTCITSASSHGYQLFHEHKRIEFLMHRCKQNVSYQFFAAVLVLVSELLLIILLFGGIF
jgi:hypothetical protein